MSRQSPLVYLGSLGVRERARQILPGCAENTIAEAIVAGHVRYANGAALIDGPGWQATARRTPGHLRPSPRAWTVSAISRTSTTTEGAR